MAEDEPDCVELLSAAFSSDPGYRYIFPDPIRLKALVFLYARLLRMAAEKDRTLKVAITDDRVVGVLLASKESRSHSIRDYMRHGLAKLLFLVGLTVTRRMLRCDTEAGELRKRNEPGDSSFYVSDLAVRPDYQGKGVGSGLLSKLQGPVYLLTTNPENLLFYQKQGFKILDERRIDDAFPAWALYRSSSLIDHDAEHFG